MPTLSEPEYVRQKGILIMGTGVASPGEEISLAVEPTFDFFTTEKLVVGSDAYCFEVLHIYVCGEEVASEGGCAASVFGDKGFPVRREVAPGQKIEIVFRNVSGGRAMIQAGVFGSTPKKNPNWNSTGTGNMTMSSFSELWPIVQPYTLLHRYKAEMLHKLVEATRFLEADVAECGVFRGGMTLMMAKQLEESPHKVFAFDSFAGLPKERGFWETCYYQTGALRGSYDEVANLLASHGLLGSTVELRLGMFDDTLKSSNIPPLSLVHIDCDVYCSVKSCLDLLYDKVLPGGIIVIDDYLDLGAGAEQAVVEHLRKTNELLYIGPIEQAFIVKGRLVTDDPATYVGWKPEKLDSKRVVAEQDWSVVMNNAEYLRDLSSGAALPDMPGHSLVELEKLARRMLDVWSHHQQVIHRSVCER
jgi:Macrocin-O-methyltransferase (TylF)